MLELIGKRTCPFVQRVRIVLALKDINYDFKIIDTNNKPDWFLAISPTGKVPLLKNGEQILFESHIICEYLNELQPEPALLPLDPYQRARARFWASFADTRLIANMINMLKAQDKMQQIGIKQDLHDAFMDLEAVLTEQDYSADKGFWFGEQPSLVDVAIFPFINTLKVIEHYRDYTLPNKCEKVQAWFTHLKAQAKMQQTDMPMQEYLDDYQHYTEQSLSPSTDNSGSACGV